ncbi:PDZ domain-containing protein [Ornithinibacillus xuwenensis]|uniref:PDZ domain-containing protein n=1 Tax=Ornithinibacillus xuwenensis TaxID=3144668 RepID=A0ABU9XJR5_9BACI
MIQDWLLEIGKGIGKLFLNPLLYWSFAFIIIVGIRRVKRERSNFGTKIFDIFSEWRDTIGISILIGLLFSVMTVGIGFVFTYETIIVLSIVMIISSMLLRFTLLSPSYTIGISYFVLLGLPYLSEYVTTINLDFDTNFTALTILLGLFLFVEAQLFSRTRQNETYPSLILGERGSWIGRHIIKKVAIIPFFVLIPAGLIEPFAPYWPYLAIGEENYALVLIPFMLGFEHAVKGTLPHVTAQHLAKAIFWLAIVVLGFAIGSIFVPWLSIIAVLLAILGREIINYRSRMKDHTKRPYFNHTNDGLKVLGIIPGSPADRLNILIGETVSKVNGNRIYKEDDIYEALQQTGSFFKIELLDTNGEIRFVQSALYEGDHHELGLVFAGEPHRKNS